MDQLLSDLQNHLQNSPFWAQILVLATSTFVSEDLTTICSGVLVSKDVLSPLTAMLGCFIGIVIGDGGLYLIGLLFGLSALRIPLLSRLLPPDKIAQAQSWFENNGLAIVFISRFLPGTRLPTYFAAGMLRSKAKYFMVAATLASAVWVPMLVGVSWYFGEKMQRFEHQLGGNNWVLMALGVLVLFWFIRTLNKMGSYRARRLFLSRFRRFIRWEFWPITVVYLPLVPYFLWLALRHRSLSAPLYVNPGIGYSGIIGESKHEILDGFTDQREFICNSLFLQPEADTLMRLANLKQWFETRNINFPFILKPDMGQRGSGVGHIENWDQAEAFLKECPIPLVAQEYSPGPFEFGVFYSRTPGEEQGTIWGITGKEFPKVVGDGETNLETLILRHPQGLGRLHIFLKRFQARLKDVLGYGERLTLVQTGNHCQGTIFLDKTYLVTRDLEKRIDAISQSLPGFHIGRFDLRASDLEAFRRGEAFKIIELNGATGEPAHMYDPRHSLYFAYRQIMKQWAFIWRVGAENQRKAKEKYRFWVLFKQLGRYRAQARYHQEPR